MAIGIVCAILREAESLLNRHQFTKIAQTPFLVFQGAVNQDMVIVMISGLGKVAAAMATQTLIHKYKVSEVSNLGICGALDDQLEIGELLYSQTFVQHDFRISLPNAHPCWLPVSQSHLIETTQPSWLARFANAKTVVMASGDHFVNDRQAKLALNGLTGAATCDMESAAIAQVCYVLGTPFASLRAVSDIAEEVPADFESNMNLALENLHNQLGQYLAPR